MGIEWYNTNNTGNASVVEANKFIPNHQQLLRTGAAGLGHKTKKKLTNEPPRLAKMWECQNGPPGLGRSIHQTPFPFTPLWNASVEFWSLGLWIEINSLRQASKVNEPVVVLVPCSYFFLTSEGTETTVNIDKCPTLSNMNRCVFICLVFSTSFNASIYCLCPSPTSLGWSWVIPTPRVLKLCHGSCSLLADDLFDDLFDHWQPQHILG